MAALFVSSLLDPYTLVKTIFQTLNDEIKKILNLFGKFSFYCNEFLHTHFIVLFLARIVRKVSTLTMLSGVLLLLIAAYKMSAIVR
jgi:hypothetical protein